MSARDRTMTLRPRAARAIGASIAALAALVVLTGCSADTTGKGPFTAKASATPEYFPYGGPHGPLWPAPRRD